MRLRVVGGWRERAPWARERGLVVAAAASGAGTPPRGTRRRRRTSSVVDSGDRCTMRMMNAWGR